MPHGGEQSPQKRRIKAGDPDPLMYPTTTTGPKMVPSPNTDRYEEDDDGLLHRNTTAIHVDAPQNAQTRITSSQSPHTSVPRRQPQAMTRNLPRPPRAPMPQQVEQMGVLHSKTHWLLPLGVGMMAMLVLWVTGAWLVAWGGQRYNDLHYGIPRTYQTDAVVGHGGDSPAHPSHFIALNLNRQAIVIELMAGDPGKSVSYVAPVYIAGDGGDLAPVTVEFRDVTGDNRLDMIIHIHLPSQDQLSVFVNTGTKFRPSNGNDKISI